MPQSVEPHRADPDDQEHITASPQPTSRLVVAITDVLHGGPAHCLPFRLEHATDAGWIDLQHAVTDRGGHLGHPDCAPRQRYRLTLDTGEYFTKARTPAFYQPVVLSFTTIAGVQEHRMTILVSPDGYQAYVELMFPSG